MAKFLSIVISFLILFSTSGCRLQTEGNTLHGFTMRMNKISETYNLTDTGYIYDEKESTLTMLLASEAYNKIAHRKEEMIGVIRNGKQ
jgi:hypothetical protein